MKLLAISVFRCRGQASEPVKLAQTHDLSSFGYFTRGTVREHLVFACRTSARNTPSGMRQSLTMQDNPYICHTYVRGDSLCAVVVSDEEYDTRVAYTLIHKLLGDYETECGDSWQREEKDREDEPEFLKAAIAKYQNPAEADTLMKIHKNLEDISGIMRKNIEDVLERGVKLDDLMEKSEDLSATSKTFYKQAKKTNSCCQS